MPPSLAAASCVCAAAALWVGTAAGAAFAAAPGTTGDVAYTDVVPGHPTASIVRSHPDGGGRRTILTDAASPAWSADGERIAFVRGGRLWVARADGADPHVLTPPEVLVDEPSWSPDGRWIAFAGIEPSLTGAGDGDLYVIGADGTGLRDLSPSDGATESHPGWTPDGSRIVFASALSPGAETLYTVEPDGRRASPLPGAIAGNHPDYSPDGRFLAYVDASGLEVLELATGAVTTLLAKTMLADPAWSPDCRHLSVTVFEHSPERPDGRAGVSVIDLPARTLAPLGAADDLDVGLAWQRLPGPTPHCELSPAPAPPAPPALEVPLPPAPAPVAATSSPPRITLLRARRSRHEVRITYRLTAPATVSARATLRHRLLASRRTKASRADTALTLRLRLPHRIRRGASRLTIRLTATSASGSTTRTTHLA